MAEFNIALTVNQDTGYPNRNMLLINIYREINNIRAKTVN